MNLSRKRTAIFCGFVLAAVFIQAGAQSAGPHGVGADKFGSPVTNAILTLRNPNGTVIRETGADNHGRFFFAGLAPGSYVMTISAFQFEPRRMIFEGPRYELPTVTIKLSPAPARGEITITSNRGAVVEAENSAQIVSVRDQDLPSHQLSWM